MSIKHIIRFGLIIICLQMVTVAFSQNRVSGNIKDGESGETLIGVNIIIKNTIKGTISDLDGNYEMNVGEALPYTLIFSMVGFETKEVEVNEANAVIVLCPSSLAASPKTS